MQITIHSATVNMGPTTSCSQPVIHKTENYYKDGTIHRVQIRWSFPWASAATHALM